MDHLEVYLQQACTKPVSLSKFMGPLGKARIGAQWFLNKTGLGSTNHFEVGGFIKSDRSKNAPDIQFHFLPAAMTYDGSVQIKEHGFSGAITTLDQCNQKRDFFWAFDVA